MKKQMIWGIATLILLLGIAAVFLLTDNDTAKPTKYVLGQSTKDLLNKPRPQPQKDASSAASKQMPGETETGHVHGDGTVHQGTHAENTPLQTEPPANYVPSEAEIAAVDKITKAHLPKRIAQVQTLRDSYQNSYNKLLQYTQEFPDSEFFQKSLAEMRGYLDFRNRELSSLLKMEAEYENE